MVDKIFLFFKVAEINSVIGRPKIILAAGWRKSTHLHGERNKFTLLQADEN